MRLRVLVAFSVFVVVFVIAYVGPAVLPSVQSQRRGGGTSVECRSGTPPLSALPPAVAAWCAVLNEPRDTELRSANSWSDDFASGAAHAQLARSYLVFESVRRLNLRTTTSVSRTQHFTHNGHWMVDIAGHGAPPGTYEGSAADFYTGPHNGGGLMRPDTGFSFENGRLVIEFDASAGMTVYGDRVWPEVIVTTAPAPTGQETNGWYAAGLFGGHPAVGCAFPSDRLSECRIYDTATITAGLSGHATAGAASVFGGGPTSSPLHEAWRLCGATDPDARCRDRFRIELERDAVTIFVNGVRYMEHRGLPGDAQLPDALLRSTVYVYFASWAYLVEPSVARVHWGRVAINPDPLMR